MKLFHLEHPCTAVTLALLRPTCDREHLYALFDERLERLALSAPVVSLSLTSTDIVDTHHHNQALFPQAQAQQDALVDALADLGPLLERLRARLGRRAVHALTWHAEHRPESAWQHVYLDESSATAGKAMDGLTRYAVMPGSAALARYREYPLWLLPEPLRLSQQQGWPTHGGRLLIHRGPERLETGWWNDADISRDYYVVSNPESLCLWIYRERRDERQWFLHGLFG